MSRRERAACSNVDPDLFFPIGSGGPNVAQIDEAKTVCGRCPVAKQCLRWAMAAGNMEGIWGGTTESERRAMRRRGGARPLRKTVDAAA